MKLIYKGPFIDGVRVYLPTGGSLHVPPDVPCDVPDSVAHGLLEQSDVWVVWAPPSPTRDDVTKENDE